MLSMVLSGVYVVICFLLLIVVLLQQGKGGDIASAFGGSGSSQAAFGARAGSTVLTRATTVLGALFIVGAMVLGLIDQRGPGSVVSGLDAPADAPAEATPEAAEQP